jgi:hypothetical protein
MSEERAMSEEQTLPVEQANSEQRVTVFNMAPNVDHVGPVCITVFLLGFDSLILFIILKGK